MIDSYLNEKRGSRSMGDVLTFLGGSGFVVVLLGGVGYVFQRPLTAWLTKRIAVGLEKQADDYKHQLSRDMERYKDELNRLQNVERVKIEVRKAVVEKLLEQRLAALHEVSIAVKETPSWVIAAMAHNNARLQNNAVLREKLDAFYAPVNRFALYFSDEFQLAYRELGRSLFEHTRGWLEDTIVATDDERSLAIIKMAGRMDRRVAALHLALPDELASMIAGRPENPPPAQQHN